MNYFWKFELFILHMQKKYLLAASIKTLEIQVFLKDSQQEKESTLDFALQL